MTRIRQPDEFDDCRSINAETADTVEELRD
jgi:hypothetical protein